MLRDAEEKRSQRGREEDLQPERPPQRFALHTGNSDAPAALRLLRNKKFKADSDLIPERQERSAGCTSEL